MRILHTAQAYWPEVSGVSRVVEAISTRLVMAGHEVHVATSAIPNVPRTEVRAGVHIHRFALAGNSVVGMAGAEAGYVDFVRTTAWDIIAMHCAQVWSTDALLSWLPSLTCPKVFVAHGLSAYHNPAYREYYARFADSLRNVDAMVSLARGLEDDDFCRDFGLSAPTVIPNGVDSAELGDGAGPPREDGQKSGPLVICLSNHNPNKGHERFFAVVRHMHREHPGASGTLMGGTYRAAKWRLGRLGILGGCAYQCWARSIVSPMIDLRASAPRPQIMELIHAADVMLLTSRWEAFPMAILESMALGTPWLAFDVGCLKQLPGGRVVRNVEEMAAEALDLSTDRAARAELGSIGRAAVAEHYVWDAIVPQYEQLYRQLLLHR